LNKNVKLHVYSMLSDFKTFTKKQVVRSICRLKLNIRRPDVPTLILWQAGKAVAWDAIVACTLRPTPTSGMQPHLRSAGAVAELAAERK